MCGLNGSRRPAVRTGVFRGGGTADSNAARTVRRCTLCRRASSRTDNPSTRASLRILANRSTLDTIPALPVDNLPDENHDEVGPNQTVTTTPASRKRGHIKPSQRGHFNLSQTSELIHHEGPWRDVDQVEVATASWVQWFNTERTHSSIDDLTPVEAEQLDYAHTEPLERTG